MADRALSPTRERGEERTAVSGKVAREELKKFGEALSLLVESAKEVHRAQCTPSRPRHQFRLMRAHSDDGRREARVGAGGLWRASRSRGLRDRPPVCPGGGRHAASRRLQAHLCTRIAPHRTGGHSRPQQQHLEVGFISPLEKFVRTELKAIGVRASLDVYCVILTAVPRCRRRRSV